MTQAIRRVQIMPDDLIPKLRTPEYPETHDRGYLSKKQRAALFLAQDGKCAGCGIKLRNRWEADHIVELWEGGTNSADNWQAFGSSKDCDCHAKKTAEAANRRAKMRRLRGETGQVKRRKERGGSLIKSRNTLSQPKLLDTQTSVEPKRWSSAGFRKHPTLVRGVNGKVRERTER